MELEGVRIGFVFTGAYYKFQETIPKIRELVENKAIIIPIMSYKMYKNPIDEIQKYIEQIETITKKKIIHTSMKIEPIGKRNMTDIMVIAPCTRKYNIEISIRYCRYYSNNSCTFSF